MVPTLTLTQLVLCKTNFSECTSIFALPILCFVGQFGSCLEVSPIFSNFGPIDRSRQDESVIACANDLESLIIILRLKFKFCPHTRFPLASTGIPSKIPPFLGKN